MKKLTILSLAIFFIYTANSQQFSKIENRITGLQYSHISQADFDNDGDIDLLMTGLNNDLEEKTILYENLQELGLWYKERTDITLQGVYHGCSDWGDFDNDGDKDIILTGRTWSGSYMTRIYENISNGASFTVRPDLITYNTLYTIPGVINGKVKWIDSDNDGDLDIMLTGQKSDYTYVVNNYTLNGNTLTFRWEITSLDGNGSWTDFDNDGDLDFFGTYYDESYANYYMEAFIRELSPSDDLTWDGDIYTLSRPHIVSEWADYTNDNLPDIAVFAGPDDANPLTRIYENQTDLSNGFVRNTLSALPNLKASSVEWGDFDNDDDPDILVFGENSEGTQQLYLFENQEGTFIDQSSLFNITLEDCYATWIDFNNDGYLDIIITGYNSDNYSNEVKFLQNNTSTSSGFNEYFFFPEVSNFEDGFLAWGDVNNDNLQDLFISGYNNDTWNYESKLFLNNSGATLNFTQSGFSFIQVGYGDAAFSDFDNDGDLDLIISGWDYNDNPSTKLYENKISDNQGFVEYTNINLTAVYYARIDWGDYDNDGDYDILITGIDAEDYYRIFIYENKVNKGLGFVRHGEYSFNNYSRGEAQWADFNNDGYLDILVSQGYWGYVDLFINDIKNSNDFIFYYDFEFPNLEKNSFDIGDMDEDGDQDIVIFGYSASEVEYKTIIYENRIKEGYTFEEFDADNLPTVKDGSVKWGDYDNDGDLDLIISGDNASEFYTYLYENRIRQSQGFVLVSGENFTPISLSNCAWADFDNDGDLDLSMQGEDIEGDPTTSFYLNGCTVNNTKPNSPSGLAVNIGNNEIVLSWLAATDDKTAQNGLTYNIRVGTTSLGGEIVNPMSNSLTSRLIQAKGNVQSNKFAKLRNLPYGTYYWGVQAIDNSFAGSSFASGTSFTLSPNANFTLGSSSVCQNDTVTITFTGYCYDTVNTTFNYNFDGGVVISGTKSKPRKVVWNTPGLKTITLQITDGINTSTQISKSLTVNALPVIVLDDLIRICDKTETTISPSITSSTTGYDVIWNNNATTQTINVSDAGTYYISVTDDNSCSSIDSTIVEVTVPYNGAEICVVTVDSGNNIVVWERDFDKGIASYNIYRQTTNTDEYELIGNLPINELSVFVDENSSVGTRSDRYKISVIDTCGNESEYSPAHKTIHLAVNLGTDGKMNLEWDGYEGVSFTSYSIYRGPSEDNLTYLADVPNNTFIYTDNPPDGWYYYQIAVNLPTECAPALKKKASAGPYSQAVSNMEKKLKGSDAIIPNESNYIIKVFPNPTKNNFKIECSTNIERIEIYDLQGKLLFITQETNSSFEINADEFNNGIYLLKAITEKGIIRDKIIIYK